MKHLTRLIRENKLFEAKKLLFAALDDQRDILKEEFKQHLASTYLTEARFKIVRVKIRRGKVLRRHKVSTMKGYTYRGGKMVRMSQKERRNRRISQRRGKIKRKAKLSRANMKRKRSMRKLHNLGG